MILLYFAIILITIIDCTFGANQPAGIERLESNYGTIVNLNLKLKGGRGRGLSKTQNLQFHIPPGSGQITPQGAGEGGPGDKDRGESRPFARPDRNRFDRDRFDPDRGRSRFPTSKDRDDRGRHPDRRGPDRRKRVSSRGSGRGSHRDEGYRTTRDSLNWIHYKGLPQSSGPREIIILGLSGPDGLRRVAQNLPADVGIDMSKTKVNYVVLPPEKLKKLFGQSDHDSGTIRNDSDSM